MINNPGLKTILRNIKNELLSEIDRLGIHYRIHERIKDINSLKDKIERKGINYYSKDGKKIQDIFGFRITTYFVEDVKLLWDIFENKYPKVSEANDQITKNNLDVFKPVHKNLVCRMSADNSKTLEEVALSDSTELYSLIDTTFEIQFRTTLSEGWHEIDHVLRYKCQSDWNDLIEESRMLNGIYAILETSDKALKSLFDDLSYQHYKKQNWEAMLRTKFRLKFIKSPLNTIICEILNQNKELAKNIFRMDRQKLLEQLAVSKLSFPLSFDNLIYFINYLELKDANIEKLQPDNIKTDFETYLI